MLLTQVLDNDGKDVTSLCLHDAESGEMQSKPGKLFMEDVLTSSGSGTRSINPTLMLNITQLGLEVF